MICERDSQPDMAQAMHLISGDTLQRQTTAKDGTLDRWLADPSLGDEEIVPEAVCLGPGAAAGSARTGPGPGAHAGQGAGSRRQAFEDVLWAIFNSKEFLYNH